MHGQEIFQAFTDLNHSDLGLCTGYCSVCTVKYRTSVILVKNLSPIFHGTDLTLGQ